MRSPRPLVLLVAFLLAALSLLFAPGELSDQTANETGGATTAEVERSEIGTAVRSAPTSPAARNAVRGFRDPRKLDDHFQRHGADFESRDAAAYDQAACALRDALLSQDVLELERADGVLCRFRRSDGAFLAVKRDGTVLTFFKPERGESYWRDQRER